MQWLPYLALAAIGYLLGQIQFGIIITKIATNVDIRKFGSGGTGATNVARTLGPLYSILTLVGDAGKAALAAYIGLVWMGREGAMLCGLCTVVGHNWPAVFGFKGGKGVAASLGALLVVRPYMALGLLLVFIVMMLIIKTVSIASLAGFHLGLIYGFIMFWGDWLLLLFIFLLCFFGVISHRQNIIRIIRGEEKALTFGSMAELKQKTRSATQKTMNATRTAGRRASAAFTRFKGRRVKKARLPKATRGRRRRGNNSANAAHNGV